MKYIINKIVNIDRNEITSIRAVENDMKTRFVNFQLLANNQPLDLTGLTIRVYGKTSKGTEVFNDLNIIDSSKGLVQLELTRPFLVNGLTEYQLKLYTSDNGVLSSNILLIDVTKDLMNNNSIEASNEYKAIETAFQKVDDSITKINNAIVDVKANQIGGTNLLSGTQFFSYGWARGGGTAVKIDRTNLFQNCAVQEQWYGWNYFYQVMCYEIGERYTISCYAKCDKRGAKIYFTLADNMTAWGMQELTTEWEKYVFSFTPTLEKGTLRIECSNIDSTNKSYISKIKLEKGSIATDWSPNPFDYEHKIGCTNLLDNTDLNKPISMFNDTGNIRLIVDKSFQGTTSIYNKNIMGLQSQGDSFGDTYGSLFRTNDRIIQPDTTYTISFNYMSLHEGDPLNSSCYLYLNKNDKTEEILYMDMDLNSHGANWVKYIKTFTTPANIRNIEVRFGFRCTAFSWLAIDGVKLEKGTIATDYSLSNSDIKNKLEKATMENAPSCRDCNWFLEPNSSFVWDTGLGIFKNTPIGDLAKDSGIVFEVINYGSEGRIQQEFRKTYPSFESRVWIRNYSSDNGGYWSDWKSEFIGENQVGTSDDFNNLTRMGCWKVQSIDSNTPNSPLKLDSNIYNFGLLNVYESSVAEEHRVLQVYFPHQVGGVGHRTPLIRMLNSGSWTDWDYIGATSKDINTLYSQISNNSGAIQEIKNNWIATGENRLNINGRSEIDVYAGGVYYITGNSVTELHSITHSHVANGQSVYFIAETLDQTANIKFCHDDLVKCGVYAPAGKDFWITGRDNGDTIFEMKKMNGTLRFLGMR